jgi:hypothetical protein
MARDVVVLDQLVPQGARQVVECGSAIGELCVAACATEGSSCARSSEQPAPLGLKLESSRGIRHKDREYSCNCKVVLLL